MKGIITAGLTSVALAPPICAIAQDSNSDRWQWEVRTEIAEPTNNPTNTDLDTGIAIRGTVSARLVGGFGVYTGLGLQTSHADNSFAGPDVAFTQRSFLLGMQWQSQFERSNLGLRLRAGAVYGDINISDDSDWHDWGDDIAGSRHGLGWEVGVALTIGLSNKWVLTPGIRYRELSRNVRFNGVTRGVNLESVNVGIGISRTF